MMIKEKDYIRKRKPINISADDIPDEIRIKLENKTNRSPEEEEILRQGLAIANRKERVRHKIIRHYPNKTRC